MKENKLSNLAFCVLAIMFFIYALLTNFFHLPVEIALLVFLPIVSVMFYIYLKLQWREYFKISEKLLVNLKARVESVHKVFRR